MIALIVHNYAVKYRNDIVKLSIHSFILYVLFLYFEYAQICCTCVLMIEIILCFGFTQKRFVRVQRIREGPVSHLVAVAMKVLFFVLSLFYIYRVWVCAQWYVLHCFVYAPFWCKAPSVHHSLKQLCTIEIRSNCRLSGQPGIIWFAIEIATIQNWVICLVAAVHNLSFHISYTTFIHTNLHTIMMKSIVTNTPLICHTSNALFQPALRLLPLGSLRSIHSTPVYHPTIYATSITNTTKHIQPYYQPNILLTIMHDINKKSMMHTKTWNKKWKKWIKL